jgi:hypothetical protein
MNNTDEIFNTARNADSNLEYFLPPLSVRLVEGTCE